MNLKETLQALRQNGTPEGVAAALTRARDAQLAMMRQPGYDEPIYQRGDPAQPRHAWHIVDFHGHSGVPCRYALVAPDGGAVAWTHWPSEARRLVRAATATDY